jgi:hypothetical protein
MFWDRRYDLSLGATAHRYTIIRLSRNQTATKQPETMKIVVERVEVINHRPRTCITGRMTRGGY